MENKSTTSNNKIYPMNQKNIEKSIFPLDKNRKLISEKIDPDGTIRKIFRLFADNGDWIDIEVEEKGGLKRKNQEEENNSEKKKKIEISKEPFSLGNEFIRLMLFTKVEDLRKTEKGKIFVAYRHELAIDVFKGLIKHNFYSCPVLNKKGNIHYGFIDLIDFVNYFIGELGKRELTTPGFEFWTLLDKQTSFKEKTVKELMTYPLSFRNPYHPILQGYSLYSAIETLAREPHLHRVPIIDNDRKLVNIITQSQIIEFIIQNMHIVGSKKDKPLKYIPELFHEVIKINNDDEVIEAFKLINLKGVTGVAVVDQDNKFIGAISTKDLKGIGIDGKWLSRLFLTADQYFQELANDYKVYKGFYLKKNYKYLGFK
jgi:CBS domain-containing protein